MLPCNILHTGEEEPMEQRLNIVAVLVEDLEKALTFYRDGLGWQPWWPTAQTTDEIDHAAFDLGYGLSLVLYPVATPPHVRAQPVVELAQFVATKAEVETVLQQATAAGAKVIMQGAEQEWGGYTAKFADLDGCQWEITWNPHYATASEGESK
jgi:uncharacterized glyoxalase superfamily protein PhnB